MEQVKSSEVSEAIAFLDEISKMQKVSASPIAMRIGATDVANITELFKNPKFIAIFQIIKKLIGETQEILGDSEGNIKFPKAINLIKYLRIGKLLFTHVIDIVKIITDLKVEIQNTNSNAKFDVKA